MIIRIGLVCVVIAFALLLLRNRTMQTRAWTLIGLAALAAVAVLAVIFPGATTWVANAVGVGRGADLVIYLLIIILGFASLILYRRMLYLQRQLTAVARAVAILGEKTAGEDEDHGNAA